MSADAKAAGVFRTIRDLPGSARFLLVGVFVNQFAAFLQPFLVLYLVHRGFSEGQAGLALGAYGVGAVLGLFFGGGLTDRLGPRLTIVVSMIGSAALVVSISLLDSLPLIIAVVALTGAANQSYRPAAASLLAESVSEARQVMVFAMNRIALNLGTVSGPLVAAWLITISWDLIFWLDGATALLTGLIALFLLPKRAVSPAGDAAPAAGPTTPPAPPAGYRTVLRDHRYLFYLAAMFANALIYVQVFTVLPLTITDAGYSTVVYSLVFTVSAGMVITGELLVTKYTQHWSARVAAGLGLALFGLGLTGYGVPAGLVFLFASVVVVTAGQMIGGPTLFAWPAKVAPAAVRGRYLGASHGLFGVGQAVGPVVGVLIWQQLGRQFWFVCGAVAAVAVFCAVAGMRKPAPASGTGTGVSVGPGDAAPAATAAGDGPATAGGPDVIVDEPVPLPPGTAAPTTTVPGR